MKSRTVVAFRAAPAAAAVAVNDGGWYSPQQLHAYREWLRARPAPFWRQRKARAEAPPEDGGDETGADAVEFEEDDYILLDMNDPEV